MSKKKKLISIDLELLDAVNKLAKNNSISANQFIIESIEYFIQKGYKKQDTFLKNYKEKAFKENTIVYLTEGLYSMPDGSLKYEEELTYDELKTIIPF